MAEAESVTLLIRRPKQWGDRMRSYAINVDGEKIGEIRAGEEKTFLLEPGAHELECRIDWCGSRPVALDAEPGELVGYRVRTNVSGWRLLLSLVYILFLRDRYLSVERLPRGTLPRKPAPVLPEARIR